MDFVAGDYTVDRAVAATHDLTLLDDATLTPIHSAPRGGEAIDLRVLVRQDGAGGHALGWDGTIAWAGGSAPAMPAAADALLTVRLLSVDDGATWLGSVVDDGLGAGPEGAVPRSTGTRPSWSHPRVPTTAGPPPDADVIGGAGEAADGILVLDTANERLYVCVGGTWRWAALT